MVERATMALTGAIQLACNRGQRFHRRPGNQKCACCASRTSRRLHTKIFEAEQTHQKIHQQLQTSQDQHVNNHSVHARS